MITTQISGKILSEELRVPLPDLEILPLYKGKILEKVSKAISQSDGSFSFNFTESRELNMLDIFSELSFKILDSSDSEGLFEVKFLDIYRKSKDNSLEILIPLKAFTKVRQKPKFVFYGDDAVLRNSVMVGTSLSFTASGLLPAVNYDVEIYANGKTVLTNSVRTNNRGEFESTMLWIQLGINDLENDQLMTLKEANKMWDGAVITLVFSYNKNAVSKNEFKVKNNENTQVFASTRDGRPVNAIEAHEDALYVSIANSTYTGAAKLILIERQHDWQVGDAFKIAKRRNGKEVILDIELSKERTDMTFLLAKSGQLLPGAFDVLIRPIRYGFEDNDFTHLIRRDLISSRRLTGIVIRENFWNAKPVLGGCVNKIPISGRSVSGAPYFQYADTFTVGENVYGGLDPGIVDPNNLSKRCALYVIQSKDDPTWNVDNSLSHLPVLGGNPSVQKVTLQPGCMNMNKHLLWSNANIPGEYDIIADFGNNTPDAATFVNDDQYNTPLDMIDGYFVPGFRIVEDPGTMTQWANAGTWHYDETIVNAMGLTGSPTITDESSSYFTPGGFVPTARTIRMQARVFYPTDVAGVTDPSQISNVNANYPLIVIVHGNGHEFADYNFLLSHFAKNGFIAVSINCKFLSGGVLQHGMHGLGRAEALFKHLEVIFAKFGTKAQNNIGIMGHSRGGEAVLKAARLNNTGGLGYNFNAIMSLAPTDQYGSEVLAGAWTKPYFVLFGSRDGDISGAIYTAGYTVPQTGFALWDRANGSEKTMAFVYLATHNGFVTDNHDAPWDGEAIASMLPPATQQAVTQAYMNAYFRMKLKNEPIWKGMFTGEWKPASVSSTAAQVFMQFQDTGTRTVDKFDGVINWQASTIGGTVSAIGLPINPDEGKLRTLDGHSPHDSQGLKIQWDNNTDAVEFSIPNAQKDVSGFTHISVRITQKDASASNPVSLDQNMRISLKDGANNERAVRVSSFCRIPFPDQRANVNNRKSAMVSVRIPLKSYTIVCAGQVQVNLTDITTLALKFSENSTGEILIDNIEFTN
jgi:Chlorophyllase enzyme